MTISCFSDPSVNSTIAGETRTLSLSERYHYTSQNYGTPDTITFVFTYPSRDLPSREFLSGRIRVLQDVMAGLKIEVIDQQTNKAKLHLRETAWSTEEVLMEDMDTNETLKGVEVDGYGKKNTMEVILERDLDSFQRRERDSGPAWRITRYTNQQSASQTNPNEKTIDGSDCFIGVSMYHWLVDGVGASRLCQAILASNESFAKLNLFRESKIYPKAEDYNKLNIGYNMKPTVRTIMDDAFQLLILPKFPKSLRKRWRHESAWPDFKPEKDLTEVTHTSMSTMELSNFEMKQLKDISKRMGIKTLHPILETMYVLAVWDTIGRPDKLIRSLTPKSHRDYFAKNTPCDAPIQTPYCLGEYTSIFNIDYDIKSHGGSTSIWDLAQGCVNTFDDPLEKKKAMKQWGKCAYIPDPNKKSFIDKKTGKVVTGWEEYFAGKAEKADVPCDDTFGSSNLGYVELPAGCKDVHWGFSAAITKPLNVCYIGHSMGLRMTATWLEGCYFEKQKVKAIESCFKRLVDNILAKSEDLDIIKAKEWTLDELLSE